MSEPVPTDLEARVAFLEAELRAGRRPKRDWDAYAAIVASLVGLLALAVAGYTAHLQRQQTRAAVWPRLSIGSSNVTRKLVAENHGAGPARVKAVLVQVDGKTMRSWAEVIKAIGHQDPGYGYRNLVNRVLPPGAAVEIFTAYDTPDSHKMFDDFLGKERGFRMLVCYCSVLEECWIAARGTFPGPIDGDRQIDRCPIAAGERFRN
jgi:hypothetical protein